MKNRKKKELTIEEQAHRNRLKDLYCGVFVVTVLVWVFRFCFDALAGLAVPFLNYYGATALTLMARALSVLIPFLVLQRVLREPFGPVFQENPRSEHPILRSILGIVSVCGLTVGAMGLMRYFLFFLENAGIHSVVSFPDFGTDPYQTAFYILLSTVLYSFAYEVSFRGIALRNMREGNGLCAVLVSGIAYSLSDGDLYGILARFSIGFVIGAFYLRIRAIWPCILLQAASQMGGALFLWYLQRSDSMLQISFLLFAGIVFGVGAAILLFIPHRDPEPQGTSNKVALQQVFFSFGVYLMVALVTFNLLVFTFSTDADPADPLLQPIPEEEVIPPLQFDREKEFHDSGIDE